MRPDPSNLAGALAWAFAASIIGGCAPMVSTPNPSPSATGVVRTETDRSETFDLQFTTRESDARFVDVVVNGPPEAWKELPDDEDPIWEKLVSLRRVARDAAKTEGTTAQGGGDFGISGRAQVIDGKLQFRPRFPLLLDERYEAVFDPNAIPGWSAGHPGAKALSKNYVVVAPADTPVPTVVSIYPTADELPANHLKFYIVFSEAMQQGNVWDHFRVVRENGEEVPSPFRETELWSEDGTRLTLWFHPGRVKEGVNLNVEIGAILEESQRYELAIANDWKSLRGVALAEPVSKKFLATAKDRVQPSVEKWSCTIPKPGTRDALKFTFGEPLDWALLQSRMWLETASGEKVAGHSAIGDQQRSWEFIPDEPWREGEFRMAIGSVLEDLAGNSLARPFEVDVSEGKRVDVPEILYRPFEVRTPSDR